MYTEKIQNREKTKTKKEETGTIISTHNVNFQAQPSPLANPLNTNMEPFKIICGLS